MPNIKSIINSFYSDKKVLNYYKSLELFDYEKTIFGKFIKKKGKLLDLMCGTGRIGIFFAKKGFEVYGVDIQSDMLKSAKSKKLKNIEFIKADVTYFIKPNYFDYIIVSAGSLENIPLEKNRVKILRNIYISLKSGGIFITAFHSFLYPKYILLNIISLIKNILVRKVDLTGRIVTFRIFGNKKLFYNFYIYWKIIKILKMAGFKNYKSISINELHQKYRRVFSNKKIYQYLRPFLPCFWICVKK